jgi:hypothetical protein
LNLGAAVLQSLKALVGEDQRMLPGEVKEIGKVALERSGAGGTPYVSVRANDVTATSMSNCRIEMGWRVWN